MSAMINSISIPSQHTQNVETDLRSAGISLAKPNASCWVLTDGKAGDEAQCLGVAQAIHDANPAFEIIRRHVHPCAPFVWAMPWGGIDPRESSQREGSPIAPPFPDILIASGRRTVPYVREVKRASKGHTFTVFLKDPRTGPKTADLIWVAEHDKLRAENVIVTLTAPHRISQSRLVAARAEPPSQLAELKHPRVAVLAGGNSRHHTFRDKDIARLLQQLESLTAEGASLMVTTSRRTPKALLEGLQALVKRTNGYIWDSATGNPADNPYIALLALADWIVVTADSTNMLGEAAASGAPLLIFEPSGGHLKFKKLIHGLEMCDIARPLLGRLEGNAYLPLDTTMTIAQSVVKSFNAHWSQFNNIAGKLPDTDGS